MHRHAWAAVAVAALLMSGCTNDADPEPEPSPTTTTSSSTPGPPSPTPTQASESPSASEPPASALDWRPVPGDVEDTTTVSGKWTFTLARSGERATLNGPRPRTFEAPSGSRFTDALIDGQFAVVTAEDETGQKPNVATVLDLKSGKTSTIDGSTAVPTTTGGPWTLGSGFLVHAATQGRQYCLAFSDLLSGRHDLGPCVPPRHGITNVTQSVAGAAAMTFDAGHPSCRTVNRVDGDQFVPLDGPTECKAWDVVVTENGQVWSEVDNERRIEEAHFFADFGDGVEDLGPGTSGTLTWCGSSAYFVRDPQTKDDPAELLRVGPDGTEVVYSSPGQGKAFIAEPRCGGRDLTVTALTAAGDEQVTARVS